MGDVVGDYGPKLEFGFTVDPSAARLDEARAIARQADAAGLKLIAIGATHRLLGHRPQPSGASTAAA